MGLRRLVVENEVRSSDGALREDILQLTNFSKQSYEALFGAFLASLLPCLTYSNYNLIGRTRTKATQSERMLLGRSRNTMQCTVSSNNIR